MSSSGVLSLSASAKVAPGAFDGEDAHPAKLARVGAAECDGVGANVTVRGPPPHLQPQAAPAHFLEIDAEDGQRLQSAGNSQLDPIVCD